MVMVDVFVWVCLAVDFWVFSLYLRLIYLGMFGVIVYGLICLLFGLLFRIKWLFRFVYDGLVRFVVSGNFLLWGFEV